jgi:predicted membrane protein
MRRSRVVSLTAVFAALHAVLAFASFGFGPWRNWAVYLEPFEGIILGPKIGFFAALLGSAIARMAAPSSDWMFGVIAEPMSVLIAGLLAEAKWKPVLGVYATMLGAYFLHPFGRALPLWTILDVLCAGFIIYPVARLGNSFSRTDVKRLSVSLALLSFAVIVMDSLVRVFLLVPGGLYLLFFPDFPTLYATFVKDAVFSYLEDFVAVVVSLFAGVPLLITVLGFEEPKNNSRK